MYDERLMIVAFSFAASALLAVGLHDVGLPTIGSMKISAAVCSMLLILRSK